LSANVSFTTACGVHHGWQVLHVAYERMLADPVFECERIAGFLGTGFDAAAAAAAVDPTQRRFR
jgi:hypothetical protein